MAVVSMFTCVLIFAVLGLSASYHHDDYGYPSQPPHPLRPGQRDPGHEGHHGHSGSWHHYTGYHGGSGRFNPDDGQTGNTGQWPKPTRNRQHPSQAHFNDDSDYSDTDSDGKTHQDGNVTSENEDQVKKPDRFRQDTKGKQNDTDRGFGQTDITGQIVANSEPFKFKDRDDTPGRGDIPTKEPSNTNPGGSNIAKAPTTIKQTGNRYIKPVANQTDENNANLTQAYITGPDNTLVKDSRANNTKEGQGDSWKPSTGTMLHAPNKSSDQPATAKKPVKERPYTTPAPAPSIGSLPVPVLGQFLAPSLQWNVGIYTKMKTPYSQICGGSLVKTDAVLTAAHCFWSDDGGALRPALFAAAAGKLLRTWDDSSDVYAQQSDIKQIHIPPRFQGAKTSFQDDIAIARLSTPFEYAPGVKPVCVDFDMSLERQQLQAGGNKGTIVGWGLTEPNGPPSERLNFLELPHLDIVMCLRLLPPSFTKYVTSDKICAGDFRSGKAACRGDSGGGLVFTTNNVPYIRGIVSTAPRDANDCNPSTPATFTQITSHLRFLTDHIPNIAEDCRSLYEVQTETVGNDSTGDLENGANVAENSRAMYEAQNTVGSPAGNKSRGNSNETVNNEGNSNRFPVLFHLDSKSGEKRECYCFCNSL